MNFQDFFLATISVVLSLSIVFFVVCLGWYLVWKIFLSRFKLVRELLGQMNGDQPENAGAARTTAKSKKVRKE